MKQTMFLLGFKVTTKQNKTKKVALRYIILPLFGKKIWCMEKSEKNPVLHYVLFSFNSQCNNTVGRNFRLMDLIVPFHAIDLDNLKSCI